MNHNANHSPHPGLTPETAAAMLQSAGYSFVPAKIDGSKRPLVDWEKYQTRRPTPDEVKGWYGGGKTRGIAVLMGEISGNAETVDFDKAEVFQPFCDELERQIPGLLARLLQVDTPRPGYQITYRCKLIGRNRGLAFAERPATDEEIQNNRAYENEQGEKVVRYASIETRGEGGYVIGVGSPARVHKNNKPYKFRNGDYEHTPFITVSERATIISICESLSELPIPLEASADEETETRRRERKPGDPLLPGDDYNARGDIKALLIKHGWVYCRDSRMGELWARPGKDPAEGHSATLFPNGNLFVFTPNAHPLPLCDKHALTPFASFAWLECNGDFKVAARELAALGYGEQRKNSRASNGAQASGCKDARLQALETCSDAGVVQHPMILKRILACLKPCDFRALGEFKPEFEIKQKHYIVLCIKQLLKTVQDHKFALARKNDFIFAYNGEYWREIEKDALQDFLGDAAERLSVASIEAQHYEFKAKLYKQFLAAARFDQIEPEDGKVLINLKNGTFEISAEAQGKREFRSEDFLKYQLPFNYDASAAAPIFTAYLERVLPEIELQQIVSEFFGYVFTRKLKLEKALLLYGDGANGKSVLFDVMNAVLGADNTANYSLSDLMQEHNRAQIAHKLLNYGSEINASVTKDTFKNLVSIEPIMARMKYGNSFLMTDYAKLCFNCNELPKDIEQTEAYFRRLLIIPFRVRIPDAEQDKELAQKIIASELSGVFNWVLDGLRRLLKNKRFTESQIVQDTIEGYKREADSVACFLDDAARKPEGLLKDVYADYRAYCAEAGAKPLGKVKFRKRLESHGYEVDKAEQGMRVTPHEG